MVRQRQIVLAGIAMLFFAASIKAETANKGSPQPKLSAELVTASAAVSAAHVAQYKLSWINMGENIGAIVNRGDGQQFDQQHFVAEIQRAFDSSTNTFEAVPGSSITISVWSSDKQLLLRQVLKLPKN